MSMQHAQNVLLFLVLVVNSARFGILRSYTLTQAAHSYLLLTMPIVHYVCGMRVVWTANLRSTKSSKTAICEHLDP